jgi:3-oxoacyl-[acyl-carrier protein] reductase
MRRALVTGGSGGIGAAICRRLAADGCYVYVHAHRNLAKATALAVEISETAGGAEAIAFDVTDAKNSREVLEALIAESPIDILINNAGIHDDAIFPGMSARQWHQVLDVALNGFFNVTQPLTMPMIHNRWGRIVNVTSIAGLTGNRGQVNYAAAKGGLHAATKALSLELASRGITVNAVAPGIIATGMSQGVFNPKNIAALVPMKRAGTPNEVADLVGFLASRQASYITGQIISVNGGMI